MQETVRENEWQLKLSEYRKLLIEDLEKEHTRLLTFKADLKKETEFDCETASTLPKGMTKLRLGE